MKKFFILGILTVVIGVGVYFIAKNSVDVFKSTEEVGWPLLGQLEVNSGFVPDAIKNEEDKEIKIAGFVVPLSDNFHEIREFLLVPDPMSCIHVPPPPPNQMVLVNLEKPMNSQLAYGPVWVRGKMAVKSLETGFGVVGYSLKGEQVKVYEGKSF
jgi:hypothetical protein